MLPSRALPLRPPRTGLTGRGFGGARILWHHSGVNVTSKQCSDLFAGLAITFLGIIFGNMMIRAIVWFAAEIYLYNKHGV